MTSIGDTTNNTGTDGVGGLADETVGVSAHWIPLGSGQRVVRISGRTFEALTSWIQRRPRRDLYHCALVVAAPDGRFTIEMAPVARGSTPSERGVVAEGPVGLRCLGRFRVFRYEVRRWRNGVIPDLPAAVSVVPLDLDAREIADLLDVVALVPTPVWGRDELGAGEMWNSNSVVSWVLTRSGVDVSRVPLPPNGRAPGWDAGRLVAARSASASGG